MRIRVKVFQSFAGIAQPQGTCPGLVLFRLDDIQIWQTGGARSRNHKKTRFQEAPAGDDFRLPQRRTASTFSGPGRTIGSAFLSEIGSIGYHRLRFVIK